MAGKGARPNMGRTFSPANRNHKHYFFAATGVTGTAVFFATVLVALLCAFLLCATFLTAGFFTAAFLLVELALAAGFAAVLI